MRVDFINNIFPQRNRLISKKGVLKWTSDLSPSPHVFIGSHLKKWQWWLWRRQSTFSRWSVNCSIRLFCKCYAVRGIPTSWTRPINGKTGKKSYRATNGIWDQGKNLFCYGRKLIFLLLSFTLSLFLLLLFLLRINSKYQATFLWNLARDRIIEYQGGIWGNYFTNIIEQYQGPTVYSFINLLRWLTG